MNRDERRKLARLILCSYAKEPCRNESIVDAMLIFNDGQIQKRDAYYKSQHCGCVRDGDTGKFRIVCDEHQQIAAEREEVMRVRCAKVLQDKYDELAKRSYPPPSLLLELIDAIGKLK